MKKLLNLFLILGTVLVLTACGNSPYIDNEKFNNISDASNNLSDVEESEYLIYFYAVTCVHCAKFKPTVKDYFEKEDALPFYAYNLDNDKLFDSAQEVAEKFGIDVQGTPTLAYIKDGVLVDVLVGEQELDNIFIKGSYKNYNLLEENVEENVEESVENK